MALTTPNMSLKTWDLLTDTYSHTDLRGNFVLIDQHDHTTTKGLQIPSGGIANGAIGSNHLQVSSVTTAAIASQSVTSVQIANNTVTDGNLANPNNGTYRSLAVSQGILAGSLNGLATFWLLPNGSQTLNGGSLNMTSGSGFPAFPFVGSNYTVAGKTLKLAVQATLVVNPTAPAASFTFGLYQITSMAAGGGNGIIAPAAGGAAVPGSTVTFTTPGATSITSSSTSDFTPPSDGLYMFGFIPSVTTAVNSGLGATCRLMWRSV